MEGVGQNLWTPGLSLPCLKRAAWLVHHLAHRNRRRIDGQGNRLQIHPEVSCVKNLSLDIEGDHNTILIEKGAQVENLTVEVRGRYNRLTIGQECHIFGGHFSFPDYDGHIHIGSETTILGAHMVASEPGATIWIGQDCLFSFDIDIRTGDSHSIIDLKTRQRLNYGQDVRIGDHVWIGAHVQILKGVSIGRGSIIGAGAVVTGEVPANSIAAGVPARVTRSGVSWLREKIYLDGHKAPELRPDRHWAWYRRGEALSKSGYYQQAVANFEQALALKTDDVRAWRGRGRALAELGRYFDAVASFSTALKLEPGHQATRRRRDEALTGLRNQRSSPYGPSRPWLELRPGLSERQAGAEGNHRGLRSSEAA